MHYSEIEVEDMISITEMRTVMATLSTVQVQNLKCAGLL